jgi:hypothetical protein
VELEHNCFATVAPDQKIAKHFRVLGTIGLPHLLGNVIFGSSCSVLERRYRSCWAGNEFSSI